MGQNQLKWELIKKQRNFVLKMSLAWNHFERIGNKGKCNACFKYIDCSNSTTTGLLRHLKLIHNIDIGSKRKANEGEISQDLDEPKPKHSGRQVSIELFMKKSTLEEHVARLAAEDRIPVHRIAKSKTIRTIMKKNGFSLPSNPDCLRQMIKKFYQKAKSEVELAIELHLKTNGKLSISADEYTSIKNGRLMNMNVHSEKSHWNLGRVSVIGSMPAEVMVSKVNNQANKCRI